MANYAQEVCAVKQDTVFMPKENKVIETEILEANLKSGGIGLLIKTENNRYFLKLVVTENLYFNKTEQLEIISGSKSTFYKDTKQFQYDKHRGYYIVEVFKNYIATLKEYGITSLVFGKAETKFSKQDCNQIKQIAKCLYESISAKK